MKNPDTNNYFFSSSRPILIFDAGALITGIDISNLATENQCFTTINIFEEEIKNTSRKTVLKSYITSQILEILEYEEEDIGKIEKFAKKSGDLKSLSHNDKGLLALCLYLQKLFLKRIIPSVPPPKQ